jgi:hypothetical protein
MPRGPAKKWSFIKGIRPYKFQPDERRNHHDTESYKLNLAQVQRCRLYELERKLIKKLVDFQVTGGDLLCLEFSVDLRAYGTLLLPQFDGPAILTFLTVQACQDYDYMKTCRSRPRDPFLFAGWHADDRKIFKDVLEADTSIDLGIEVFKPVSGWKDDPDVRPRGVEDTLAFFRRLGLAIFGAAFLIGPMWLMMLKTELWTRLISTTVFVSVFGLCMAFFVKEGKDVLSSTAAYAAVLVVFVGLSTGSG